MQQQHADYDLLAVFPDESAAKAATTKLQKEGFGDGEVFQLTADAVKKGEFREHGPNRNRGDIFLQTQRSGPNPLLIILLALAFAIVFGGIGFIPLILVAVHLLAFFVLPEPVIGFVAVGVGLVVGALVGALQRGRVRGNIGQNMAKVNPSTTPKSLPSAQTVIALRFPDPDNISRKSKARAILINNGGKIDRSIGRTE